MTTITLYRAKFTGHKVELPEACPSCAEPVVEVDEWNWVDYRYSGSYDGDGHLDRITDSETGHEFFPTEVRCRNCSAVLASAD
jgi:hypothetical protein